jgi:hypothetical protein
MVDILQIVVNKLSELGFDDDDFRNNREGNQEINFQYFYKREENSNWEVYVSYNPHSSLLTICYYDVYDKDNSYPVAYISIQNQNDALIACDLLESKANYLWGKTAVEKNRTRGEMLSSKVKKMGFSEHSVANNITTLKKKYPDYELTVLVESSVSLSAFLFKNRVDPARDSPLLAVRNIHEEPAAMVVLNYLSNFHKSIR